MCRMVKAFQLVAGSISCSRVPQLHSGVCGYFYSSIGDLESIFFCFAAKQRSAEVNTTGHRNLINERKCFFRMFKHSERLSKRPKSHSGAFPVDETDMYGEKIVSKFFLNI